MKYCAECGEPLGPQDKICANCGEPVAEESVSQSATKTPDTLPVSKKAKEILDKTRQDSGNDLNVGDRNNIMGGIVGKKVEAQSMVENTSTHVEANTTNTLVTQNTANSSQVDNSQNVVNTSNVTYNIIYQQGAPTPPGMPVPPPPAPQPEQKVPEQPVQKAPAVQHTESEAKATFTGTYLSTAASGLAGAQAAQSKNKGGVSKPVIIAVVLVLVAVVLYFVFQPAADETPVAAESPAPAQVEQPAAAPVKTETPAKTTEPVAVKETPAQTAPAQSTPVQTEPAAPAKVTDANYEAGMKAYEAADGLQAVKSFKASASADALYMLGVIYEKGCGSVGANAMMARKYYKEAAAKGSSEAQSKL